MQKIRYSGGITTLRKILHDLGFFFKLRSGYRYLQEKPDVASKRYQFLKSYMSEEFQSIPKIFIDETWIFRKGSHKTKEWQDYSVRSCSVRNQGGGGRFIITHAGGKSGYVEGALLLLDSGKQPTNPEDDYHGDMNGQMFRQWFTTQLLPNLKEPSVIVMDNASYHSVQV